MCMGMHLWRRSWRHMASCDFVNIGSGNGLLHSDSKRLHKLMLTYNRRGIMASITLGNSQNISHWTQFEYQLTCNLKPLLYSPGSNKLTHSLSLVRGVFGRGSPSSIIDIPHIFASWKRKRFSVDWARVKPYQVSQMTSHVINGSFGLWYLLCFIKPSLKRKGCHIANMLLLVDSEIGVIAISGVVMQWWQVHHYDNARFSIDLTEICLRNNTESNEGYIKI